MEENNNNVYIDLNIVLLNVVCCMVFVYKFVIYRYIYLFLLELWVSVGEGNVFIILGNGRVFLFFFNMI